MPIDLNKLEALAKKATPGPWFCKSVPGLGGGRHNKPHIFADGVCLPVASLSVIKGEEDAAYIVAACNAVPELIARIRELERQRDEAIHYILTDEGHSMIDWRMCLFAGSCECEPHLCKPDYEMCKRAVKKSIEESGE